MNKHERIRKIVNNEIPVWSILSEVEIYSKECEATEKELEELKRDVKRYFELSKGDYDKQNEIGYVVTKEFLKLGKKLSKVGEGK